MQKLLQTFYANGDDKPFFAVILNAVIKITCQPKQYGSSLNINFLAAGQECSVTSAVET